MSNNPKTLHDLFVGQYISLGEVHAIARALFTDATTMAGPEGYLVTGVNFDDLPKHVRDYITKGIMQFTVKNVIDANAEEVAANAADDDAAVEDGSQD